MRLRGLSVIPLLAVTALVEVPRNVGAEGGTPTDGFPACTRRQESEWQLIAKHQLGLAGRDSLGHYFGPVANRKKASWGQPGEFGGRNWFPADVVKKTACGALKRFTIYKTPLTAREEDLHPFLDPDPPFAYLFEDARVLGGGRAQEFWGEITVPEGLKDSRPWFLIPGSRSFSGRILDSELQGYPACMYGAWVFEEFHDNQPEIHPAEQIWFRDPRTGDLNWILMQDSSNRFDQRLNYCEVAGPGERCKGPSAITPSFRAWAESPLRARVRVPFELTGDDPIPKRWRIAHGRRGPQSPAPGTGQPLARRFQNALLLVQVPATEPEQFFVSLSGECTTGGGTRLQGYVEANSVVSAAAGGQAYHWLVISNGAEKPTRRAEGGAPRPEPVLKSLRHEGEGLAGAFEVRAAAGDAPRILTLRSPGSAVDGLSFPQPQFSANFKDPDDPKNRAGRRKIESDLEVFYNEGTQPGSEAVAESLNAALHGQPRPSSAVAQRDKYLQTFGPTRFQLEVTATTADGAALPIRRAKDCDRVGQKSPAVVDVCLEEESGLEAPWLDAGEITDVVLWTTSTFQGKVTLDAKVTDPFGGATQTRRSFTFPRPGAELDGDGLLSGLAEELAEATGFADLPALRAQWALDKDAVASHPEALSAPGGELCGSRARRARLLNLYAKYASRDGDVGSDERDVLRALARRVKETPEDGPDCKEP